MPPLTAITFDWRPTDAVYQLLAQHSIPRKFVEDQLPEFILYWQERGELNHSWGSKFSKHVLREWRRHEIEVAQQSRVKPMTPDWMPSNKARNALLELAIPNEFIEQCVLTFRLYWLERGERSSTWNSRFVQHVKFDFARYQQQQVSLAASTRGLGVAEQLTDRSWANK